MRLSVLYFLLGVATLAAKYTLSSMGVGYIENAGVFLSA